jgi:predicted TIM-barrel fold metal-dependent hydrolase
VLRTTGFGAADMIGRRRPFLAETPSEGLTIAEVCDPATRTATLEAEGVVAEVFFPGPDFARQLGFPFGASGNLTSVTNLLSQTLFGSDPSDEEMELNAAGERAYNRWLADYCAQVPGRTIGLIHAPLRHVDAAVSELRWGKNAGLRGVQIPSDDPRLPPYWEDRWEPFWAACEDLELPVHFHGGTSHTQAKGLPDGNDSLRSQILALEGPFWFARPLKVLLYSGIMERHPKLNFVFTEFSCEWVPNVLARMEWFYSDASLKTTQPIKLPRSPSEYWYRQCYAGASLLSRDEVKMRDQIGVDNMMYGVDFPHPEGSWGRTMPWLQQIFGRSGITEEELRKILGLNAVELYGLDVGQLQAIADRVGPTVEEIVEAAPRDRAAWGDLFAYSPGAYRPVGWSPQHVI